MSRNEMLNRVNSKEYYQWFIYHNNICPIGVIGEDLRNAFLCSVVASALSGKKYEMDDFMLSKKIKKDRAEQTIEQQLTMLKAFTNMGKK